VAISVKKSPNQTNLKGAQFQQTVVEETTIQTGQQGGQSLGQSGQNLSFEKKEKLRLEELRLKEQREKSRLDSKHLGNNSIERIEKPVVVKETIFPRETLEIQPVIHREIQQKEVHQILQPMREKETLPTQFVQKTLPDQIRPTTVQNDANFQVRQKSTLASSTEVVASKCETITKQPIVQEDIHKTVIEEIQPVLYKETVIPTIVRQTQPIYEKIIEAPVLIKEERAMQDLGCRFEGSSSNGLQNQSSGFQNQSSGFQNQSNSMNQSGVCGVQTNQQNLSNQQSMSTRMQKSGFENQGFGAKVEAASFEKTTLTQTKIPIQSDVNSSKLV